METNVKIVGFANDSFNGKSISSKGFDINYDGNIADVNAFSNGKVYYMRLGNEDIQNLLSIPPSSRSLEENLSSDYNVKPMIIKYKSVKRSRPRHSTRKSVKSLKSSKSLKRRNRNTVRFASNTNRSSRTSKSNKSNKYSKSRSRSRKRSISQRTLTPYYQPEHVSQIRVPVPSIERTIY